MGDGGVRVRKRALFFSSHLPDLVRSYRSATSRPQRLRAGAVGGSPLGGKGLAQLVGMSAPSPVQRKDQGPSSSEVNLQPLTPWQVLPDENVWFSRGWSEPPGPS